MHRTKVTTELVCRAVWPVGTQFQGIVADLVTQEAFEQIVEYQDPGGGSLLPFSLRVLLGQGFPRDAIWKWFQGPSLRVTIDQALSDVTQRLP